MAIAIPLKGYSANASENSSRERPWFVHSAADEADAIAAVVAAAPSELAGLVLRTVTVDEEVPGGYRCAAVYGSYQRRTPPKTGESQFNFEIGTQPIKVVVPIGSVTVNKRAAAPALTKSIQLIGETLDPNQPPEGADVFEPSHVESETHYLDDVTIDATFKANVKSVVGKVNAGPFKGHDAGECLCIGVSGSKRGAEDWEVTFRWQVSENQSNLTIAGISSINKKGWEYLWPIYSVEDDDAKVIRQIDYICVAQVFRTADFANLGIGT